MKLVCRSHVRLPTAGLGAVASYGTISNITYGGGLAVAWIAFVRQTGRGPLMPGQWKAFLAFYAGFWTVRCRRASFDCAPDGQLLATTTSQSCGYCASWD